MFAPTTWQHTVKLGPVILIMVETWAHESENSITPVTRWFSSEISIIWAMDKGFASDFRHALLILSGELGIVDIASGRKENIACHHLRRLITKSGIVNLYGRGEPLYILQLVVSRMRLLCSNIHPVCRTLGHRP